MEHNILVKSDLNQGLRLAYIFYGMESYAHTAIKILRSKINHKSQNEWVLNPFVSMVAGHLWRTLEIVQAVTCWRNRHPLSSQQ